MHIAVFYQYYHNPDCAGTARFYSFFRHWAPRHRITLVTTGAVRARRQTHLFDWAPPGVAVHEFDVPYDNAMGVRARLKAFGSYAARAALAGLRLPRPDVIVGISTPLTTALAAALVARVRRVPWVFVVQDLWPDFPIQMGAVRHPLLARGLYALERWLYRDAAHVVTLSPDMTRHVVAHTGAPERITTTVNGTDFWLIDRTTAEDVERLRRRYGLHGKRVVLYAGTFGRCNNIPLLLAAAARLQDRSDLRFVFVGGGFHDDLVREAARTLPNVLCAPPQPRHQAFGWFKLADVALVPFLDLPVLATNSPAKFFDSLAAGTPVVVTNPGWTRRFVEEHGCGWYVPARAPEALADRLTTLFDHPGRLDAAGRRGAAAARTHFDRRALADTTESLLRRIVAGRP